MNIFRFLRSRTWPVVPCWIDSYDDQDDALCFATIAGSTVLPVTMPADVLQSSGLKAGDHFRWRISSDGSVQKGDIILASTAPPRLSRKEEREANRLYEKYKKNPWHEAEPGP